MMASGLTRHIVASKIQPLKDGALPRAPDQEVDQMKTPLWGTNPTGKQ